MSNTGLVSAAVVTVSILIRAASADALLDDHLSKWENSIGQKS